MENLTFIQIGTAVGNDLFYKLVSNFQQSTLILVEPIQHQAAKEFYANTGMNYVVIDKAIVPNYYTEDTVSMYMFHGDSNLSSLLDRKAITSSHVVFAEAMKIGQLLDIAGKKAAGLFIDTEGLDAELLCDLDLQENDIDIIFYEEWIPYDDDKNEKFKSISLKETLENKLEKHGYELLKVVDTEGNKNPLWIKKSCMHLPYIVEIREFFGV